jgi:transglutaminase-like putative cysteine protease
VDVLTGQGVSQDNLIFVLFLSILFWFLGHNTAWHIFRVDRVWRAILPPGLVILVNVFYYTGDAPLDLYLALYAVLALLLIARSAVDEQEWEWYLRHITFPPQLRTQFLRWGTVLAVVLVGAAWMLPNGSESESLERVQEFLNSDPLDDLNQLFNRLFASLESEGLATADYYGGNSLQLSGAIQLGDKPVMLIDVPPQAPGGSRYYWRSRTFSTYEGGRWTPNALLRLTVPDSGFGIVNPPALAGRTDVGQQVTMVLEASRLVYTAPQPQTLNLPVVIDLSYVGEAQELMDVSVIRPRQVLRTGDKYSVVSSIASADAPSLRAAGTDYPLWVLSEYLQIGSSVTQRTRDLASQIVTQAGVTTPYDQAKAIERWLRQNIAYSETIPGPPSGYDPIDWVLFEDPRGYCNYYASAMIMMLRSQGIPARMVAGFSQGEWDDASQGYLVRERDAHTWVEVYFPGYGWVEFEPTAAQAPLERPDAMPVLPQSSDQMTSTPPPTNTPLPTATSTETPLPTSTPDQSEGVVPVIPPTPTLEPSATPAPPLPPTIGAPPNQETQSRSPLEVLGAALLSVLVVVLVIVLVFVLILFVIWWIEWRGMGGLSPVQRAYALIGRYAGYLGLRLSSSFTPDERRRIVTDHVPGSEQPVRVITDMYVEETYGPRQRRAGRWNVRARNAWYDARKAFLRMRLGRLLPKRWRK